jgi:hypothetical protein
MSMLFFWVMMLCGLVEVYQGVVGTYRFLNFQMIILIIYHHGIVLIRNLTDTQIVNKFPSLIQPEAVFTKVHH